MIGAATHQVWDSFTHAWMWPARALYPGVTVSLVGHDILLSKALQLGSSVVGAGIVFLYVLRIGPRPDPTREAAERDPARGTRPALLLILVPLLGSIGVALLRGLNAPGPSSRVLWDSAWSAALSFLLMLGAGCLVVRLSQRLAPKRD